jgi:hypothetical protein
VGRVHNLGPGLAWVLGELPQDAGKVAGPQVMLVQLWLLQGKDQQPAIGYAVGTCPCLGERLKRRHQVGALYAMALPTDVCGKVGLDQRGPDRRRVEAD